MKNADLKNFNFRHAILKSTNFAGPNNWDRITTFMDAEIYEDFEYRSTNRYYGYPKGFLIFARKKGATIFQETINPYD